jgi:hypothetical protein
MLKKAPAQQQESWRNVDYDYNQAKVDNEAHCYSWPEHVSQVDLWWTFVASHVSHVGHVMPVMPVMPNVSHAQCKPAQFETHKLPHTSS